MLVLNRKLDEKVRAKFGDLELLITVLGITRTHIRLGFIGPREIQLDRFELLQEESHDAPTGDNECRT